jgi:hypothetical protein
MAPPDEQQNRLIVRVYHLLTGMHSSHDTGSLVHLSGPRSGLHGAPPNPSPYAGSSCARGMATLGPGSVFATLPEA